MVGEAPGGHHGNARGLERELTSRYEHAAPMFAGSPFRLVAGVIFTMLLLWACASDIRSRRIPNPIVLALGVGGLVFSVVTTALWAGLTNGLSGFATGLGIWLPFWLLGMIGAGDVKLFAAAGAWLGPWGAVQGALVAALLGGVLTLCWLVWEKGMAHTARGLLLWWASRSATGARSPRLVADPRHSVPYGVALALGVTLVAWLPGFGR